MRPRRAASARRNTGPVGGTPRADARSPFGSPSYLGDGTREARIIGCPAGWHITGVTFKIELEREEDRDAPGSRPPR